MPKLVFCFCVATQTFRIRPEATSLIYTTSKTFWTGVIQDVDNKISVTNERGPLPKERAL